MGAELNTGTEAEAGVLGGGKGLALGMAEADGVGMCDCRKGLVGGFGFECERARGVDATGVGIGFVKLDKPLAKELVHGKRACILPFIENTIGIHVKRFH